MATLNTGKLTTPNGYHVTGAIPIDDRSRVTNLTDLITTNTFGSAEYNGQITYVKEDGNLYLLVGDTLKTGDKSNWKKIATEDSISQAVKDLGPVFKFKGVASAIDPDHTSLTIGQGTININGEDLPLISWGTSSRNIFNQVMYAWGTEQGILIYTEDPYISDYNSKSQKFYIESGEMTSQYITVFDTIYVNNQNTVNEFDEWIDSQGNLIYTKTNPDVSNILDIYPTSNPDGTVITYVEPINYTYHSFEEDSTFYDNYTWTVDNLHQEDANSENNGHVYQLGEEEYASNGHMWVQLGSPKTDWIVL